jgi:hypothetical protein
MTHHTRDRIERTRARLRRTIVECDEPVCGCFRNLGEAMDLALARRNRAERTREEIKRLEVKLNGGE